MSMWREVRRARCRTIQNYGERHPEFHSKEMEEYRRTEAKKPSKMPVIPSLRPRTVADVFNDFVTQDMNLSNTITAINVVNAMAARIFELEEAVKEYRNIVIIVEGMEA